MPQVTDCHNSHINAREMLPQALVALGANQPGDAGSPESTLRAAIRALGDSPLKVERVSRIFATPCYPPGAGPDYVNAAVILSGSDDAHHILRQLHQIEDSFGRARVQRWGQRTLDLDLLAVGERILPDLQTFNRWRNLPLGEQATRTPDQLILPHPRIQDRAFVLVPLADVAPDWVHPVLGLSVSQMLELLPDAEKAAIRPL